MATDFAENELDLFRKAVSTAVLSAALAVLLMGGKRSCSRGGHCHAPSFLGLTGRCRPQITCQIVLVGMHGMLNPNLHFNEVFTEH